jgi:ketosteroid isomerase-like protein
MPEESVEMIVRRIYDQWGRGNFSAGLELFGPDTLLVLRPGFPESGEYRGPEEIGGYMRGFLEPWDDAVIAAESFIANGDCVVVGVHQQATGKGSGAPVEFRYFQVWTFAGETVLRMESIRERSDALEAAGL